MIPTSRPRQADRPTWSTTQLVQRRAELLAHSRALSTNLTYDSALHSYITFCTRHSFALDPSPDTLSFYVTYMSTYIKPSSVGSYLSGILNKLKPYFPNVRATRRHPLVTHTLQGAMRLANTPVQRKRPLTPHDLRSILQSSSDTDHDDLLFCALTFTGFFGLLRPSELCFSDSPKRRDVRKLMLRHLVELNDNSVSIPLHAHKADQQLSGNTVLLIRRDDDLNPIPIIIRYLSSRDRYFPLNPELWTMHNGTVPRYSWFVNRLKKLLPGNIGGSSLRSGGADHLAQIGTDPALIQACGRWASEAYKVYLRTHPAMVHHLITTSAARHVHLPF